MLDTHQVRIALTPETSEWLANMCAKAKASKREMLASLIESIAEDDRDAEASAQ